MNGDLTPLTKEQRLRFAWLDAPAPREVIAALEQVEPSSARFVGGCVRDSLFGEAPKDFDIATTLTPEAVMDALRAAQLGAAPTGLEHGTVTAIAHHQGIEVTTLRADVSTDGRRATVAFTRDWAVDAGRRDFTINAIYLTPDGRLYDPAGGVADAKAARVRFIGDPAQRIREDFLRILRFFRFSARFSQIFDPEGLAACARLKDGIALLSAERVGAEMMAILALPRAVFALRAMQDSGVLAQVWDAPASIDALARLKEAAPDASPPVALAVVFGAAGTGIGSRLRLSNAEKAVRSNALAAASAIAPGQSDKQVRALIYRFGREVFLDGAATARAFGTIDAEEHARLRRIAEAWEAPALPVSGRHVLAAGVPAGPAVARILSEIEEQWIAEDFPPPSRVAEILKERCAE